MDYVMNNEEFIKVLAHVSDSVKTLYVKGCFGAPMTEANKKRYSSNNDYNKSRAALINAASSDTFGFDCVCLIKGVLWGWCENKSANYGGASYASNNVPDIGTEKMISVCTEVSTDFSKIVPGELLWMPGHVGVYIGDGLAVECTPSWKNCVQTTAVGNRGKRNGFNVRIWDKHGKLPYIQYLDEGITDKVPATTSTTISVPVIKRGTKNNSVKAVQALLNMRNNAGLEIDGSCGALTEAAIRNFQKSNNLAIDGSCGSETWTKLIG